MRRRLNRLPRPLSRRARRRGARRRPRAVPVADELVVRPVLTAVLEHRRASSSCCAAPLGIAAPAGGGGEPAWLCTACERPCDRVLADPVEVSAHG